MTEPSKHFKEMLKMAGDNAIKASSGKTNDPQRQTAEKYFQLLLIGILLFVGADAMKVLLRRNFGNKSISLLRIGIASSFLFLWGVICLAIAIFTTDEKAIDFFQANGGQPALIITAVFYLTLSINVFIIGYKEREKSKTSNMFSFYAGESILLRPLVRHGIDENIVQKILEPLLLLSLGIFMSCVNIMLGIPILICSFFLPGYEIYEKLTIGSDSVLNTLQGKGVKQNRKFNEVRTP